MPNQLLRCAKFFITDWALIVIALMHAAGPESLISYTLVVSDASDCMLFGCIDVTKAAITYGTDIRDGEPTRIVADAMFSSLSDCLMNP